MLIPNDLIETLRNATSVAVLTGAGVSAESGVPTFRDAQTGLWAQYDPTELATPEAFQQNATTVWNWYKWRRELVLQVSPNPGHVALAHLQELVPQFTLITQNVDGLHQRAGSQNVLELHGSIMRTKCFHNQHVRADWPDDTAAKPPLCERCGSPMRPDVVWFGEGLPTQTLEAAVQASLTCELFFSIGTSAMVQPAASLAVSALRAGVMVIEINPNKTPLTPHVAYALEGASGVILPQIIKEIEKRDSDRENL